MSHNPNPNTSEARVYQIRLKGHLAHQWADWFEGLTITMDDGGDTFLTGPVVDQAALHGVLKKVRDVGMSLLSINSVHPGQANALEEVKPHIEASYLINEIYARSKKECT